MSASFDDQFVAFQSAIAGRYSLERELGRGGMGIVYLAREVRLDRLVAIKLLPPKSDSAGLRERFLREARTAAKLSHPHVVAIYSVEEVDHFVFFVMAYVEGKTLTARVRERGPLAPSEAAKLLREVAWALAYAHEQGVIHRDVKPDNILLEDATDRALVADFGIAGLVKDAATLDGGQVVGTPEFMSPEQVLGETVDHRSDLYSLGGVAFFALSGRLAFEAPSAAEVLKLQVTQPAPALTSVAPGVPRRLAQLVDQCLAKEPAERPQSAAAVGEHLSRNLGQRRELPVALRAFVKHDSRLDGAGVLIYPFVLVVGTSLIGAMFQSATAAFATFAGGMTLVPAAVLIARARRLLAGGFEHGDLEVAFKTETERSREERGFGFGNKPTTLERLLKLGGIVGWGGSIAGTLVFTGILGGYETAGDLVLRLLGNAIPVLAVIGTGSGFAYLALLQRRRDVDTEFWGKLWTGRLGRAMIRIARALLPKRTLPSAMTHRPTEMVIALAADQLFEGLPKDVKRGLGNLPDVVARLETDARRIRARLEELQDTVIDDLRPAGTGTEGTDRLVRELRAEREKLQARLADTVAALETIRLSLLHLHAGKVSVSSLTTDLGRAREIADDVDRLMQGAREVSLILKPRAVGQSDG